MQATIDRASPDFLEKRDPPEGFSDSHCAKKLRE
jgi:hypothetical protein